MSTKRLDVATGLTFLCLLLVYPCTTGCSSGPESPRVVEVRKASAPVDAKQTTPGQCALVENEVWVSSGDEPVCLYGPLLSVAVVSVPYKQLRVKLRVRCGCAVSAESNANGGTR